MARSKLSERAKHRLRLAAALLRNEGYRFECNRADFYDRVSEAVRALSEAGRSRLREDVDWVEAYCRAEVD